MPITTYIVDDEAPARKRLLYLFDNFLKGELEVIGQSSSPADALEQIPNLSPELLFLDVEMPEMTGIELAEKLKATRYKGKIIFVTAYGHYSIKAIRANAFDYLLKPVDIDELNKAIERLKSGKNQQLNTNIVKRFDLTKREIELITHLSKGFSSEEIAAEMFLSKHTVDTHRRNIFVKTGVRNTVELLNLLR